MSSKVDIYNSDLKKILPYKITWILSFSQCSLILLLSTTCFLLEAKQKTNYFMGKPQRSHKNDYDSINS